MQRIVTFLSKAFSSTVKQRIQQERLSRLNRSSASLPLNSSPILSLYRNIATIAHIDAGKTTLTERMLYLSGAIPWLGEVHHGTALMDFMEEERRRGITINSACITFAWKNTHINLIDTPGHADFNFEVERSLKVLNGAVLIIDGVKGVEAQTETVWRQADKYGLAKLLVVNKMDREGADFDHALKNVEDAIGVKVLPACFPLIKNEQFAGVVDIFSRKIYSWKSRNESEEISAEAEKRGLASAEDLSRDVNPLVSGLVDAKAVANELPLSERNEFFEQELSVERLTEQSKLAYTKSIERMVEIISEGNETITEDYLSAIEENGVLVSKQFLEKLKSLSKELLKRHPSKFCIAVPCSALKNKGVNCVLDSILEFLPAPTDQFPGVADPFIFVFKTIIDRNFGLLAFAKIMAGKLSRNQILFNANSLAESKAAKILRIRASEYAEIESAGAGDLVAITGLAGVSAGDNLMPQDSVPFYQPFLVKGFEMKEPLFHASLEFEKNSDKEVFGKLIGNYLLEDPALKYRFDEQTGQFILSGLGELHVETKLSRLKSEHDLRIAIGKARVALKEMAAQTLRKTSVFKREMKGSLKFFELTLQVEPIDFVDGQETSPPIVEIALFEHHSSAKENYAKFVEIIKQTPQGQVSPKVGKEKKDERQLPLMPLEKLHPTEVAGDKKGLSKLSFMENPIQPRVSTKEFRFTDEITDDLFHINCLQFEYIYLIQKILEEMAQTGPLTFSSLVNTKITVVGGQFNKDFFDPIILKMATVGAFHETLTAENIALLEPIIEVQITVKNGYVNEIMNNAVSKRGGRMGEILNAGPKETTFTVELPMLSSSNYSSYLRTVSSGDAKFSITNKNYGRTSLQRQQFLIKNY